LLAYREKRFDAAVIMQSSESESKSASEFESYANVLVKRIDTGWRPAEAERSYAQKAVQTIKFVRSYPAMLRFAKSFDPDAVYSSQQQWDCLAAEYISKKLNKPHIVHLHYPIGPWLRKQPLKRLLTCDHVVTDSKYIRDLALEYGVSKSNATAILNTIKPMQPVSTNARADLRKEFGAPDNAIVIGNIARLAPPKRQLDLMMAFDKIAVNNSRFYLVIVGDGELAQDLKDQAKRLKSGSRIYFAGQRNDVAELMRSFDIFAHPSLHEAFGLAVLEASSSSLPVVAYNDGGIKEIVIDGETGLLASPSNIDQLSEYLKTLAENPEMVRQMGEAGKKRAKEHFAPSVASRKFADLLDRLSTHR